MCRNWSAAMEQGMTGDAPRSTGSAASGPPDLTVFYDGDCPLCRSEIGFYRGCAGAERIAFVDVATTFGGNVAPDLDKRTALARFHARRTDGTLVSGAAGFGELWLALPGWRWLGRVVTVPAVSPIAEAAYRGFLRLRPAIQWLWRRRSGSI